MGQQVAVAGSGFTGGEDVDVILASTPTTLATVQAAADGTLSYSFVVPVGLEPGAHTLTLQGATANAVFPFVLLAADGTGSALGVDTGGVSAAGSGSGTLPRTGQETGRMVALSLGLVLLGAGGVFVARRLDLASGKHH